MSVSIKPTASLEKTLYHYATAGGEANLRAIWNVLNEVEIDKVDVSWNRYGTISHPRYVGEVKIEPLANKILETYRSRFILCGETLPRAERALLFKVSREIDRLQNRANDFNRKTTCLTVLFAVNLFPYIYLDVPSKKFKKEDYQITFPNHPLPKKCDGTYYYASPEEMSRLVDEYDISQGIIPAPRAIFARIDEPLVNEAHPPSYDAIDKV